MKTLLLAAALFVLAASPSFAQCGKMAVNPTTGKLDCVGSGGSPYTSGTADPAACTPGVTVDFWNTTSLARKYCSAPNTWTSYGTSTGLTALNGLAAGSQTFTNDTNITIVSGGTAHVITWAGTLSKARHPATTMFTDQATVYGAFLFNLSGATHLQVPTSAGYTPTTNGHFGYDSTANSYRGYVGAAVKTFAFLDSSITGTAAGLAAYPAAGLVRSTGAAFAAGLLSDITVLTGTGATAITNLGLGTAAGQATGAFEVPLSFTNPLIRTVNTLTCQVASGSLAGCLAAADWTTFNGKQGALGYTPLNPANNLSEVTAATARTNLGLGTAATQTTSAFEVPLTFSAPLVRTVNTLTLPVWGSGARPVAASALGTSGNCAQWGAVGLTDAGSPCGSGTGGANALGTYLVQTSTNAPANAQSMGALATGLVKNTTTTGVQSIAVASDIPTIPLATGVSGTLPAAQFPALTGPVTTTAGSLATTIGAAQVTNAMLAGSIAATNLVGSDIATVGTITTGTWSGTALAAAKLPNAGVHTGDVSGTFPATTVNKINGVALSGLATGILKNTTTTGVPSIAVAGDFPTLNQATTGNAATATALAANGTNCSAGSYASGIDSLGNAEGCTVAAGGTSSVFTGSTATAPAFSATPTFSLADVSVKSPRRVEPGALTANVTAVTFTNKTAGAKFSIAWTQDGTGGRTIAYGVAATNTCTIAAAASATTTQFFEVGSDGTTVNGVGCNSTVAGIAVPEAAAPAGVGGSDILYADSTAHRLKMNNNNGTATQVVASGADINTSDQVTVTHLASALPKAQGGTGATTLSWVCETGLGDGLNAVAAGTYLQSFCWNKTGATVTLTSIQCYTDNAGTSTMNAANGASTALLTGAVTCSSTIASGTQSGTTTIANNDFMKFTFVADGTSKQTTWVVGGTY